MNVLKNRLEFLEKHLNGPTEQATERLSIGSNTSEECEPSTPDATSSPPSLMGGIGSDCKSCSDAVLPLTDRDSMDLSHG